MIANTLARTYIEYSNSFLLSKTKSGYEFIEKQVQEANRNFLESELELTDFKKKEKIFSINEESSIILQRLAELNQQHQEVTLQIANAERNLKNFKDSKQAVKKGKIRYTANPEKEVLIGQLEALENEIAMALVTLKENHPDVKILHNKIQQVKKKLEKVESKNQVEFISDNHDVESIDLTKIGIIEGEIESLKFRKNFLLSQLNIFRTRLEELTNKQFLYEKLLREFEKNQLTLKSLNSKLEAARILKANDINQGSIRIIDKAYPPLHPLKRKKIMFILIGFVVAIIFGIGISFIAEYVDESLCTPEEAESYLGLPVLGTIPKKR
jgi:uncharacterized protein involved in exopolysaccharide biosynthesis